LAPGKASEDIQQDIVLPLGKTVSPSRNARKLGDRLRAWLATGLSDWLATGLDNRLATGLDNRLATGLGE